MDFLVESIRAKMLTKADQVANLFNSDSSIITAGELCETLAFGGPIETTEY